MSNNFFLLHDIFTLKSLVLLKCAHTHLHIQVGAHLLNYLLLSFLYAKKDKGEVTDHNSYLLLVW